DSPDRQRTRRSDARNRVAGSGQRHGTKVGNYSAERHDVLHHSTQYFEPNQGGQRPHHHHHSAGRNFRNARGWSTRFRRLDSSGDRRGRRPNDLSPNAPHRGSRLFRCTFAGEKRTTSFAPRARRKARDVFRWRPLSHHFVVVIGKHWWWIEFYSWY